MRGCAKTRCTPPQALSAAPSRSQGHTALHTFRTCQASNASLVRRVSSSVNQLPYLPLNVHRFHYRSTHKKGLRARGLEPPNITRRFYPTLRNDRPIHVNVLCKDLLSGRQVQLESRQIAVVDTVEIRSESLKALKLASTVRLH